MELLVGVTGNAHILAFSPEIELARFVKVKIILRKMGARLNRAKLRHNTHTYPNMKGPSMDGRIAMKLWF